MRSVLQGRAKKAGLPPGSLIHVGERRAETVSVTVAHYDQESFTETQVQNAADCRSFVKPDSVTWINVDGLHEVAVIEALGKEFDIHPLTIEDILNTGQRPKLDILDEHLYLVLKMHRYDEKTGGINAEQVSLIIGHGFLLTFQETAGDAFEAVRTRLRTNRSRIRKQGADYLAYTLLDSVVDGYFSVLERIGEEIDGLEDELMATPDTRTLHRIHFLKREMLLLRKSVWPLREVLSGLQRNDTPLFGDGMAMYLRDLYDHTIQVIDTTETFRDMTAGMLDIYLSSVSNRMNEVIKVLTMFAVIFIPLTFIAGLYGMNFNTGASPYNMPELNWYYGYPFALGLMTAIGLAMVVFFKKKNWF